LISELISKFFFPFLFDAVTSILEIKVPFQRLWKNILQRPQQFFSIVLVHVQEMTTEFSPVF